MSSKEFQQSLDLYTKLDYLKGLEKDPAAKAIAIEMARAGASQVNIQQTAEKAAAVKKATTEVDIEAAGRKYFSGDWRLDIDKQIDADRTLDRYIGTPQAKTKRYEAAEKTVEAAIISRKGEIKKKELRGRTFVWTVKWPDGKTEEVKYDN